MAPLALAILSLTFSPRPASDPAGLIEKALTPVIESLAAKYNCAYSIAVRGKTSDLDVRVAAGISDRSLQRAAKTSDPFVWGSVTKMVTGASVLRLVDAGELSLSDSVPPLVDAFLAKSAAADPTQNFTSLSDLWGPEVIKITVRDLLGMTSGIPDYDTASPSGRQPTDSFRAMCYASPSLSFSPMQLLSVPWARTGRLIFTPGSCPRKYHNCYSSSNFVLLGILLAAHADAASWKAFPQESGLAPVLSDFDSLRFAVSGPPSNYTPVRGYDMTKYNNNTGSVDVSDVAGVFGGWTASDLVVDAADAATLAQDLYGPQYKLVSKPLVDLMYSASSHTGYGLATFNLTRLTPNDIAYGHLGATYGYQSVVVYIPSLEISISIGTNIERDHQDQPQDAFCSIYNTAKAVLQGKPIPKCTFTPGYYTAGCKCE